MLRKLCATTLIALLAALTHAPAQPASRYFPDTGEGAVYQHSRDLRGSAVAMYLALEPGQEDLPLLTMLRFADGARTVIVYATNGDATPNDLTGEPPQYTAARRKEEAYAAASLIGAQVYFLNLPDPGIVNSPQVLEQIWGRDTTTIRLQRAIRSFRPDLLILGGDYRGDTLASPRHRLLTKLALEASSGGGGLEEGPGMPAPWKVARVVAEMPRGPLNPGPSTDAVHPVWRKSYRSISTEAGSFYQSLRFTATGWEGRNNRTYAQIAPPPPARRKSMLDGLPQVGKTLVRLRDLIRNATAAKTPSLRRVAATIDSVEYFIAREGNGLTPGELRLVAVWKNTLEDLRCSLLGVEVMVEPTDSVVTRAQLLNLKISAIRSRAKAGNYTIFFPGARERKWGINESAGYKFDLTPPQEFRVLTPVAQEFNAPVAQFGMLRPVTRTRFSFLIFHEEADRSRNFIYRGELLLQFAPMRTFEVLTPAIRAQEGEPVVYRLVNVSRDGYRGTIGFADSLARPGEKTAMLEERNQVVVDTLRFESARDSLPEIFAVKVQLSGEGVSTRVLARRFDALTDTSARVGLVTPFTDGVVEQGLRRLRIPHKLFRPHERGEGLLDGVNTIIIDRDALSHLKGDGGWGSALTSWAEKGGHLVVLQQRDPSGDPGILHGLRVDRTDPTEPTERLDRMDGHPFLRTPNRIGDEDWRDWVVSRSVSAIGTKDVAGAAVVIKSGSGESPYLVTVRAGKGRVTFVELDLVSQLSNIHPGAHRLLANIIRPGF